MHGLAGKTLGILLSVCLLGMVGTSGSVYSATVAEPPASDHSRLPVFIEQAGKSAEMERPAVPFDHDKHTAAEAKTGRDNCAVCHKLEARDKRLKGHDVQVFEFPKAVYDPADKAATMYAYHNACVSCHRSKKAQGKKTGPLVGLCGQCHVRNPKYSRVTWAWQPVFDYKRHARHVAATKKLAPDKGLNVVPGGVRLIGEVPNKECQVCHHSYDEKTQALVYKKDFENGCKACHKDKDDKNARSMKKVAHAACIGCHMKMAQERSKEVAAGRVKPEDAKKGLGPFECKGCHGVHKELKPEEIAKQPRLVRGQKDVMDLFLEQTEPGDKPPAKPVLMTFEKRARMKVVPFNHKAHEPRGQFCNTCHHYSLEKCGNCHTLKGDKEKGGGITYEEAFHKADSNRSCVGCHGVAKKSQKCAGCHTFMTNSAPQGACKVCHRGPSGGKLEEVQPIPLFTDKEKVPESLDIKILAKEFQPAKFPHMKVVNKLASVSNESSLARWFHGDAKATLCEGCHHNMGAPQAINKVPACVACHSRPQENKAIGRPGILGAYHQQCIGCHEAMRQKPNALECVKCHKQKDVKTAVVTPAVPQSR